MSFFKKLLFVGFVFCASFSLPAQTSSFRFGIETGLNLSTALVNDATCMKLKAGYRIGGTVEYLLPKNFLIQSGLFFSAKGSKIENLNTGNYEGGEPDFTHTFNQFYLELPLYGAYRMNVSDKFNVTFGGGPYFGYGLGGKVKEKLNSSAWGDGSTQIEWDTFGDGVYDEELDYLRGETLKRFDIGIGVKVDFEYHKFILGIGTEYSLKNIAVNDSYGDPQYRNVNLRISLGYKY
jgi:hypothetical protein